MGANSASRRYSGSAAGATFNQVDARAVHPPVTSWNVVPRTRMRRSFKSTFEGGSTKCERRTCATACDLDAQTLRYFLWRQFPWLTFLSTNHQLKVNESFVTTRNHFEIKELEAMFVFILRNCSSNGSSGSNHWKQARSEQKQECTTICTITSLAQRHPSHLECFWSETRSANDLLSSINRNNNQLT